MTSLGALAHFAQLFADESAIRRLLSCDRPWEQEGAFTYIDVTNEQACTDLLGTLSLPEGVTVEIMHVQKTIPPHRHMNSGAVAVVVDVLYNTAEAWSDTGGGWCFVQNREVLVIPRGEAHGFRLNRADGEPFYVVVVSYPRIKDGDVHYLEGE